MLTTMQMLPVFWFTRYGPHIFHTNSRDIFEYLSRFTTWRGYEHRVLASVEGKLLPIPINLDTINRLYGLKLAENEVEKFLATRAIKYESPGTSEEVVLSRVGTDLYEKFFRNYPENNGEWILHSSMPR